MIGDLMTYGAVTAKVRALWGKRLAESDYRHMLSLKSVVEVAAFLRTHPGWAGALSGVSIAGLRREGLELALRRHNLEKHLRLFSYLPAKQHELMRYPVLSVEMEQIMRFLTLASAGRAQEYSFNMPAFFSHHSKINYQALSSAVTYDDMLAAVHGTDFGSSLRRLKPDDGGFPSYTRVEAAMNGCFFRRVKESVEKSAGGKARDNLLLALGMQADLKNIAMIMRVKRYYPQRRDEALSYLIPFGAKLSPEQLRAIYSAPDEEAAQGALMSTYYGRYFRRYEFPVIEAYYYEVLYGFTKRHISLSPPSVFVPVCYLFLQQVELSNLIHVIESVRYGIAPEKASGYLTGLA